MGAPMQQQPPQQQQRLKTPQTLWRQGPCFCMHPCQVCGRGSWFEVWGVGVLFLCACVRCVGVGVGLRFGVWVSSCVQSFVCACVRLRLMG